MSIKILMVTVAGMIALTSCGKRYEEMAWRKQQINDSIAFAAINRVDPQGALKLKLKMQQALYDKVKYDYDNARDQLRTIKEFHLTRTPENTQKQINDQKAYIDQLDDSLTRLSLVIDHLENKVARK